MVVNETAIVHKDDIDNLIYGASKAVITNWADLTIDIVRLLAQTFYENTPAWHGMVELYGTDNIDTFFPELKEPNKRYIIKRQLKKMV